MKVITSIRVTYDSAKCYVLHRGKISEELDVENGVRHSCIQSPASFPFAIGDVLQAALSGGRGGFQWKRIQPESD